MLSVMVDRFLEIPGRRWTRRLALESLSSVDRVGFGNDFEEYGDGYLYGNEGDVKEKRRMGGMTDDSDRAVMQRATSSASST